MRYLVLCLLLLTGCTGWLIDDLERRQMASCVWWETRPFGAARGVTATGGASLERCLQVPCSGR